MATVLCMKPEFFRGTNKDRNPQKLEMSMETLKTVIEYGFGPVFMRSYTLTPHDYVSSRHDDTTPQKMDGKWYLPVEHLNSTPLQEVEKVGEFWKITTSSGSVYLIVA